MEFTPIESQEDFDTRIKERLERKEEAVRREYADYDELKTKASQFDELQRAKMSELEREREARQTLEAQLAERDKRDELTAAIAKAAQEYNVPTTLVRGSTIEEIEEHAKSLSEALQQPIAPSLAHVGAQPEPRPATKRDLLKSVFDQFM